MDSKSIHNNYIIFKNFNQIRKYYQNDQYEIQFKIQFPYEEDTISTTYPYLHPFFAKSDPVNLQPGKITIIVPEGLEIDNDKKVFNIHIEEDKWETIKFIRKCDKKAFYVYIYHVAKL